MAVSVSYAAVELAKKIFSDLSEKTVVVGRGGRDGQAGGQAFHCQRRPACTGDDQESAACSGNWQTRFGGTPVAFEGVSGGHGPLPISSWYRRGAAHYLVGEDDVQRRSGNG